MNKKNFWRGWIWILLLAGFLARLFAFALDFAFDNDVNTFQVWAIRLFDGGFGGFYSPDFFADYPPVYMYVLWLLGAARAAVQSIFGEEFWQVLHSPAFRFFTFLPAILADLGIGFVLYKFAAKGAWGLLVAAAWIFNPAVILISGVWGQVESVFVLILLVSLWFLREKKLMAAYVLFGLAIMTKPQSLFLGPLYLYSAYDFLQTNAHDKRLAARGLVAAIFAGVAAMVLVSLPFGLLATARQIRYGMGLYGHASVNASNLWLIVSGNWGSLDSTLLGVSLSVWGVVIALAIIFAALAALHVDRTRHDGRHFFLIVAAIFVLIFAFSVRMHERYLFPALAFLLLYYAENKQRREFVFYWAFSAVFFLNCLEVLRWANAGFDFEMLGASSIYAVAYVVVFLAVALIFMIVKILRGGERLPALPQDTLKNPPKMRTRDFVHIGILIAVYAVFAFTNLGDRRTPQTTWESDGDAVRIDFGEVVHVSRFQFLMGARHDVPFGLQTSRDGEEWLTVHTTGGGSVFAWHCVPLEIYARYMEIGANAGLRLQEVAFRGADGEILPIAHFTPGAENLFDEQHLVPESRNFMNSTYFDEIFHPRTGYEFVHGLRPYETTHPPLGKVFMSWSIRAFGMTPFAWRLPGTVFGVLMIPLLYAFARKLLKSNNYALFAAAVFTFDFMLFSHTRLATIDTFVVFFVIAMYFLLYCYINGIERNSLRKSLALLAMCGASMGLAIASKWQGVYGAIGLPLLFFPALYKLWKINPRHAKITFAACFGFFLAIPAAIYVASYVPFVAAMGGDYGFFRTVWNNQTHMLGYHSVYVLDAEHPFASQWWSWPLIATPLWQYVTVLSDTMRQGMSSMGNPAVWWFGIFAAGFAIFSLARKRRHEADTVFLLVAYAANFLPWIFVTRLTFIYHYFPAVPFVVLLIALFFRRHVRRDFACFAYAGVVIALFVMFFPVLSGRPVALEFVVERLRWFSDWWFV